MSGPAIERLRAATKLDAQTASDEEWSRLLAEALNVVAEHDAWLDARDAEFDDRWNARMEP